MLLWLILAVKAGVYGRAEGGHNVNGANTTGQRRRDIRWSAAELREIGPEIDDDIPKRTAREAQCRDAMCIIATALLW